MGKITRRNFIKLSGLGATSLAFFSLNCSDKRKTNILLLYADDYKANAIAALGNPVIKTPNLDALVKRGLVFSNAYTMGSMIGAVCLPSRTMLLTGRNLFRIPGRGMIQENPAAQQTSKAVLLPTALANQGYETYHIGKSGNEYRPGIDAFEHNIIRDDPGEKRALSSKGHADGVIEFLNRRKKDRPFFIYMAPPTPHDPFIAPKEYMDMYDPDQIPLPANYKPEHPFDNGELKVRDEALLPWPRTPELVRRHLADYYACITFLDFHIGRILAILEQQNQLDNTIIIFAGDNGLSVGDHGLIGKQNLYEWGGMHVPLIIAGPGIPKGKKTESLCYLMDIYPTLCDLLSIKIPSTVEGKSMSSIIQDKTKTIRDGLILAYKNFQRAIIWDSWKLILYNVYGQKHTQLFNLKDDPWEKNNLADDPEQKQRIKDLTDKMQKLCMESGDTVDFAKPDWGVPVIPPWGKK